MATVYSTSWANGIIVATDMAGDAVWYQSIDSANSWVSGVAVNGDILYVVGFFDTSLTYPGLAQPLTATGVAGFVLKVDATTGVAIATGPTFPTSGFIVSMSVAANGDGDVALGVCGMSSLSCC